jgi:hypothetical protein
MSTDLAVIVTAHDETAVCGPTMRTADLAIEAARERGFTVQAVVGLDQPTEGTSAYFHQSHFDHWERRVLHEGEPGRARNALVHQCDGRYIAFLSAYDLCSENWLAAGVAAMEAAVGRGQHVIAHPELNVTFDGQKMVYINIDQNSPLFTSHFLYYRDYYDSPCLATREAHLEIPYVSRDVPDPDGLPAQDSRFTIETMGSGWRHLTVKDTIIFRRRRGRPGVIESNGGTSIVAAPPEMAIDRVRDLGSARR